MTWKEVYKKWGDKERYTMSKAEETAFVADCFEAYELGGFIPLYQSPYDLDPQIAKYTGKPFKVIARCTTARVDLDCLPQWIIEFADGKQFQAYPEEICRDEVKLKDLQRAYPEPGMAEIVMAEPDVPLFDGSNFNDKAVVAKLQEAIKLFEAGSIWETKCTLKEVVKAIGDFEQKVGYGVILR